MPENAFSSRLLKKVQMQGGALIGWVPGEVRDVLSQYATVPRERANVADGPFSGPSDLSVGHPNILGWRCCWLTQFHHGAAEGLAAGSHSPPPRPSTLEGEEEKQRPQSSGRRPPCALALLLRGRRALAGLWIPGTTTYWGHPH